MIRNMTLSDVDKISSIILSSEDFDVGNNGHCYTYESILNIPVDPTWISLVAAHNDELIGFAFCKQMTVCWSMIDTLYILPEYRGQGHGKTILAEVSKKVKEMGVPYLSLLADIERQDLIKSLNDMNMVSQKTYVWLDKPLTLSGL
jgi:GNAT superfamily N-acetyltransferase